MDVVFKLAWHDTGHKYKEKLNLKTGTDDIIPK